MAPKHLHPQYTRDEVTDRVRAEGPIRYADLAGTWNDNARRRLSATVKSLLADGTIKRVTLDGIRLYALADWRMNDEQRLQYIMGRCRPEDGCMVWTGYVSDQVGPVVTPEPGAAPTSARRVIWEIKRGRLASRRVVRMAPGCDENCLEYTHMRLGGRGELLRGRKLGPMHRTRVAQTQQGKSAKLDWDKVREIRASTESQRALAKRYGVVQRVISRVVNHQSWREQGGMFTSLMKDAA